MMNDIDYSIEDIDDIKIDEYFGGIDFVEKEEDVKTHESNLRICLSCKSNTMIDDYGTGNIVCCNCGQVSDTLLDHNPEWRQYDEDGKTDKGRCAQVINKLLPQSSLGTRFMGNMNGVLHKLHIWNSMPYRERSLNNVFKKITEICEKNNIKKNIQDDAKIMYKIASDYKHEIGKNKGRFIITRGKNRVGIIAACVFLACKKNKCSRSLNEISEMFNIEHTDLSRGSKNLYTLLNTKKFNMDFGMSRSDQFVFRYCNSAVPRIKEEYTEQAMNIAKNIERLGIATEHTPVSIAVTSIVIMAELNGVKNINRRALAEKFNISDVTIAKTYKKVERFKKIIVNEKLVDQILKDKSEEIKPKISDIIIKRMKKFGLVLDEKTNIIIDDPKIKINKIINEMEQQTIETGNKFMKLANELDLIYNN